MTPAELSRLLPKSALAFRGYNVTNLGRTAEMLAQPAYGPIVERWLRAASDVAADALHRPVDLTARVRAGEETTLESYGEAVTLIMASQAAQLEILQTIFAIDYKTAKFTFGYSLGEVGALVAGDVFESWLDALRVPLALAEDCVALAQDVTLGVLFTRSSELPANAVRRTCLRVNEQGRGVMGISTYLAPNSVLLLGQGDTLDRFVALAPEEIKVKFHLRRNEHRWPPLHTPIVWERHVPDRAAVLMHTLRMRLVRPHPKVLSMITGGFDYTDTNARRMLQEWVYHPQLLWNVVDRTLSEGVAGVIHLGPEPNLVPATFRRLSDNVRAQARESLSMRALSAAARRRWLKNLLPERTALFRAPYVQQIILEDWLLENAPR
jgi:[acyl-carrier-protein] S-malonyltransferase